MKYNIHNYDDIFDIKKPQSSHKPMDRLQRAAQFAPFAALTGYETAIQEVARIVDKKIELSEEQKDEISYKLTYLQEHIGEHIVVELIYFVPDKKKQGGAYKSLKDIIKKIDEVNKKIILSNKLSISFDQIYSINLSGIDDTFL